MSNQPEVALPQNQARSVEVKGFAIDKQMNQQGGKRKTKQPLVQLSKQRKRNGTTAAMTMEIALDIPYGRNSIASQTSSYLAFGLQNVNAIEGEQRSTQKFMFLLNVIIAVNRNLSDYINIHDAWIAST